MKKLAARDYEDLLQVNAHPAYNSIINICTYTEFTVLHASI